jgi:hypothetical protein
MLLETLDIKKNDVIIYSQNLFDLEKNFGIIYKDDPKKESKQISFYEVRSFVNEFTPKNLIVYRLLTNIKDFEIYLSKYGFFININGETELIYSDPIFAIKELEDFAQNINSLDLRFRIQQVGLTTLNRKGNLPNYAEIYSVDMESSEAKFQNDKIFADAIISIYKPIDNYYKATTKKQEDAFNLSKVEKKKNLSSIQSRFARVKPDTIEGLLIEADKKIKELNPLPKVSKDKTHKDGIRIISHDISEDKTFNYKEVLKINLKTPNRGDKELHSKSSAKIDNEVLPKLLQNNNKNKSEFGKFLETEQKNFKQKKVTPNNSALNKNLINIFKSSDSLHKFLKERENKTFVLKLNKK